MSADAIEGLEKCCQPLKKKLKFNIRQRYAAQDCGLWSENANEVKLRAILCEDSCCKNTADIFFVRLTML